MIMSRIRVVERSGKVFVRQEKTQDLEAKLTGCIMGVCAIYREILLVRELSGSVYDVSRRMKSCELRN